MNDSFGGRETRLEIQPRCGARMSGGRPRVVIVGGGVAGVEAALALRDLAPDEVDVVLVAPEPDFVLRPKVVEAPFTHQPAERHELQRLLDDIGGHYVRAAVHMVDVEGHTLYLGNGTEMAYDLLLVCVGGRIEPAYQNAETFWTATGDLSVNRLIGDAYRSFGRTLVLVAPPSTSWRFHFTSLRFGFGGAARSSDSTILRLRLLTPESKPLSILGHRASDAVAAVLSARHILVKTSSVVVEDRNEELHLAPHGPPVHAGVVLALPKICGPRLAGVPDDPGGFIPVDEYGQVEGAPDVYAAGDATNFWIKQGGLATQQADAAAEHIAARLGAHIDPSPFRPHIRGQLNTGVESMDTKHHPTAGHGEDIAWLDHLWWPDEKVSGRYLCPWLGHETAQADLEPAFGPIDIEVSWGRLERQGQAA